MSVSADNLAVLEHVFKRPMGRVTKVTLTLESLCAVMEATRADEKGNHIGHQLDGMINMLKGNK